MIGILINNLGTPKSCSTRDVRAFLKEFLSDPRVVTIPRIIWWLILNLIILNTRPAKSAKSYEKIWTNQGSPLLFYSHAITQTIANHVKNNLAVAKVELGMRYGEPGIKQALTRLKQAGAKTIVVLPLYPQFSYTTTASTEDEVQRVMSNWSDDYHYKVIHQYYDDDDYISALAQQVQRYWEKHGQAEKLLMSFHGIPQEYSDAGDPYQAQCKTSANLLAQALRLKPGQWQLSFQSRLGPKKWLTPYTEKTLANMATNGIKSVQVICPGFSVDCLETLEEIAMENKEIFLRAGGENYDYIPCLNDTDLHCVLLTALLEKTIQEL